MNLIKKYEPDNNRNKHISPDIIYVVHHNSHIYKLNNNLNALSQKLDKSSLIIPSIIYNTIEEYLDNLKKEKKEIENREIKIENDKKELQIKKILYTENFFKNNEKKCLHCNISLTINNTPISLYHKDGYKNICKKCNTLPVCAGIIPYFKVEIINSFENNNIIPILNNYITENIHNTIEYCNLAISKSEHGYMIETLIYIIIQSNFLKNYSTHKNNLFKLHSLLNNNYKNDNIIFNHNDIISMFNYINNIIYENYITDMKNFLISINNEYKIICYNKQFKNNDHI